MKARFVIQEIAKQLDDGWHEVTITDTETGQIVKGRGKTYKEAEQDAWLKLKNMESVSLSKDASSNGLD